MIFNHHVFCWRFCLFMIFCTFWGKKHHIFTTLDAFFDHFDWKRNISINYVRFDLWFSSNRFECAYNDKPNNYAQYYTITFTLLHAAEIPYRKIVDSMKLIRWTNTLTIATSLKSTPKWNKYRRTIHKHENTKHSTKNTATTTKPNIKTKIPLKNNWWLIDQSISAGCTAK